MKYVSSNLLTSTLTSCTCVRSPFYYSIFNKFYWGCLRHYSYGVPENTWLTRIFGERKSQPKDDEKFVRIFRNNKVVLWRQDKVGITLVVGLGERFKMNLSTCRGETPKKPYFIRVFKGWKVHFESAPYPAPQNLL